MTDAQKLFTLQPAGLRDLSELTAMEKICFPLDAWPLIDQIGALMLPACVRIKAVRLEKMIGFIGGDIRRREQTGLITTIMVLPEHRRMGVGEVLLQAAETEMGMPILRLAVRKSNLAAQNLYLKHGYHQVETWPAYYQGGEDAIVMQKRRDLSAL